MHTYCKHRFSISNPDKVQNLSKRLARHQKAGYGPDDPLLAYVTSVSCCVESDILPVATALVSEEDHSILSAHFGWADWTVAYTDSMLLFVWTFDVMWTGHWHVSLFYDDCYGTVWKFWWKFSCLWKWNYIEYCWKIIFALPKGVRQRFICEVDKFLQDVLHKYV